MSLDSPLKRVVQSVTDNIHDKDSDGHRGKRPKFDKPLGTSGSSSVPDTDTSPGSLVSDHNVQDALQLEDDQLCGESSPPPYSEAICSPAPQALSPEHLPPDSVQDSLQQCHNNLVQDLQGTQGENADHVCFGMLRDIYVQIKPAQDLHSLSGDQSFGIPSTFATLALSIQWNRGDFLSKTGTPIATLNCETHRQLSSVRVDEDPIWLGVMPMDELQQRIRVVKKRSSLSSSLSPFSTSSSADFSSSMETCKMNIFVFGPLVIEDVLARELGWHRLYLDHPDPMPDRVKYYNPQWFYTEGTPFYERLVSPPIPGTADQHQHDMDNSDEPGADKSEDDEDDDADAQAVPDGSSNLHNEAYIDSRIRTELKSYQREAVSFILSRETIYPHSSKKKTLWHLENRGSSERVYKHKIAGMISSHPEYIRGGILADDMGLGKTLSMIASIVTGLSCVETTLETPADTIPFPVKSTLVVVPTELILHGWIEEVEKHVTPGTLQCYKYHGPKRQFSLASPPLMVLATYDTVAAEFSKSEGEGVLNQVHWHRLILDEGTTNEPSHTIQDHFLVAMNRWKPMGWAHCSRGRIDCTSHA